MTTESITSVPATDGQKKQIRNNLLEAGEAAIKELALTKEEAQRLVGTSTRDLKTALIACLRGFVVTDEFSEEEVESEYRYLSGYEKAGPHAEQFARIKGHFPQAESYDITLAEKEAPAGSEGNFLILPWQRIADTYEAALAIILAKLSEQRNGAFVNYRDGELGPDRLRESAKKAEAMKSYATSQSGHDVLVVAAQLGKRHRGRSVRRARVVMSGNEFGLGAYEMGFILLTHPNRLENYDDLWVDCAGDEYRFGGSEPGVFLRAPCFGFDGGKLEFDTNDVDCYRGFCGAASGFSVVPSE